MFFGHLRFDERTQYFLLKILLKDTVVFKFCQVPEKWYF